MQIAIRDGYVGCFSMEAKFADGIEVEPPENLEDFKINSLSYKLVDGVLVKDEQRAIMLANELKCNILREQRDKECFPIINRGSLWYDRLTEEQTIELKKWYSDWLDVTDTLVVPTMPDWIY